MVACGSAFAAGWAAPASEPTALARMIVAAEAYGDPLAPRTDRGYTYALRSAEFVGRCRAVFGTVQVARFFYVRSGDRDENPPPHGHSFVLFFDGSYRLRTYWELDAPLDGLCLDRTILRCGEEALFDFVNPPPLDTILVAGKPQSAPAPVVAKRRPLHPARQR